MKGTGKRVILPKIRDPRFITIRRGGSLRDDDHRLLAMWAADCAEHALHHFEQVRPTDDHPRRAIDLGRAWARGEIPWAEARTAAGHANAAARDLRGVRLLTFIDAKESRQSDVDRAVARRSQIHPGGIDTGIDRSCLIGAQYGSTGLVKS